MERVVEELAGLSQPQRRDLHPKGCAIIWHVDFLTGDLFDIVSGDRLKEDSCIRDRAGDGSDMVLRPGHWDDAARAHQPVGWFETDNAAAGGRPPNGSSR